SGVGVFRGGRRAGCIAGASDRRNKAITVSGDILDIAKAVTVLPEYLAQRGDMNPQRAFLDNSLRPDAPDQLILADDRAGTLHQANEDLARTAAQSHRSIAAQQHPLSWIEYEGSKGNIECHDSTRKSHGGGKYAVRIKALLEPP